MTRKDPRELLNVLASLENMRRSPAGPSKRQFPRWVVRGEMELHTVGTQLERQSISAQIRDVSWGGVGFICDRPLPVDSLWRAEIIQHGYIVGTQMLLIRFRKQVDEDLYLIGSQIIADPAVLLTLGVTPSHLQGQADDTSAAFLAPTDLADTA